jgi:hypothetical protein
MDVPSKVVYDFLVLGLHRVVELNLSVPDVDCS